MKRDPYCRFENTNENTNKNFVFSSGLEFVTSIYPTFFKKSEKGVTYKTTSVTAFCTSISPFALIIENSRC